MSTALHVCLAMSLEVDAISIASADEAYSGGPISVSAKVDTLRAVAETFRFIGRAGITPTALARQQANELVDKIEQVLEDVLRVGDFVTAIHQGVLGSREDGVYPGRIGKDTVKIVQQ